MLRKIISGGQTGSDLGGLEAAKELGLETGGTAPQGWLTEIGPQKELLQQFGLIEGPVDSQKYVKRTTLNVDNSDGTIAFRLTKNIGTDKTIGYAQSKKWQYPKDILAEAEYKPIFVIHNLKSVPIKKVAKWLLENKVETLNVAGHRESVWPGLQKITSEIIKTVYHEYSQLAKQKH